MAYFTSKVRYKYEKQMQRLGDGENTYLSPFDIKESESTYSRNLISSNYPSFKVRDGYTRKLGTSATALTSGKCFAMAYDNLGLTAPQIQDNTIWKYWNGTAWANIQTGLTANNAIIKTFNTQAVRYSILANGANFLAWDGTSVINLVTTHAAPIASLITIDDYRIYAIPLSSGSQNLHVCAAADLTDWSGTDSDLIPIVGLNGFAYAMTTFGDDVIVWGEYSMHRLLYDNPEDFYLTDPIDIGSRSRYGNVVHNGVLYFIDSSKRIRRYAGGFPEEISQKINSYLDQIPYSYLGIVQMGAFGDYLYCSIPYGATAVQNNLTLVYDTKKDIWNVWGFGAKHFAQYIDMMYCMNADGKRIFELGGTTTDNGSPINFSHIGKVITENTISRKKTLSELYVSLYLPTGSALQLQYSTTVDGSDFVSLYDFTASSSKQVVKVMVPTSVLQNVDYYRLKFEGFGPCTIYHIETKSRVKVR